MIPWNEKVAMLSINPDAATRDDIARMASELMEFNQTAFEEAMRQKRIDEQLEEGDNDGNL